MELGVLACWRIYTALYFVHCCVFLKCRLHAFLLFPEFVEEAQDRQTWRSGFVYNWGLPDCKAMFRSVHFQTYTCEARCPSKALSMHSLCSVLSQHVLNGVQVCHLQERQWWLNDGNWSLGPDSDGVVGVWMGAGRAKTNKSPCFLWKNSKYFLKTHLWEETMGPRQCARTVFVMPLWKPLKR